jgi:hypothetical protein
MRTVTRQSRGFSALGAVPDDLIGHADTQPAARALRPLSECDSEAKAQC